MKAKSILAALLLLVAGLQTAWAQKVLLYKTNSQTVEYQVSELDSIVFVEAESKLVQQIVLSVTSLSLQPNDMRFLTATVLPENAQNKVVTWQSSDTNVAEVNQSGRVIANANGTCVITCRATDGSGVKATCQVTVGGTTPDEHEYVDLFLPSGTLWATCNVGANSPEEYGDYFAWGETTTKSEYSWGTYKWLNEGQSSWTQINKYTSDDDLKSACWYSNGIFIGDKNLKLEPEDDAATANWGSEWRMPDHGNLSELFNSSYTTTEWMTVNGVSGRKITSKVNGNSIFLPAAGYREETSLTNDGSHGYYWSRNLDVGYSYRANVLGFSSGGVYTRINDRGVIRCYGQSVRPVRVSSAPPRPRVTNITLNQTSFFLEVGKTQALTATVLPSNAINKEVTWTSSDTSVATVSTSGMVTAKAIGTSTITCSATDGSGVKAECKVKVFIDNSGTINGRDYVDLGLPSGTKWATCNVGASRPEDYGDYFAWGEITTSSSYYWSSYKYFEDSKYAVTKYCTQSNYGYNGFTDNLTELQPADDAAIARWGSGWQMPSLDQMVELYNSSYTTTEWTQVNGVNGRKVTSKSNGNSIFLPAAGYRFGTDLNYEGSSGFYWSRSLYPDYSLSARYLTVNSNGIYTANGDRYYGRSVRPVRFSSVQRVTSITLSQTSLSLEVGKTQTLTATVLPSNATNKTVVWTSSNTSVATVSTSGMVTAKASGTCTITCAATDGSGVKATCQVRVGAPAVEDEQTFTVSGVSFKMKKVAGGTFTMGSTTGGSNEQPVHQVTLSSFSIGETEVTQELWQAVMGSNPSYFKGNKLPVEQVSWNDCQEFITKLNQLTGKTFRLPTEAEWEYAARGGNQSKGYTYSGSNTIGDVAWYWDNIPSQSSGTTGYGTQPVATKAANELGIYDMSGNVWEFCQDWYGAYSSGSQTNPTGPSSDSRRVARGGSWGSIATYCRVAYRNAYSPSNTGSNYGLRLAL